MPNIVSLPGTPEGLSLSDMLGRNLVWMAGFKSYLTLWVSGNGSLMLSWISASLGISIHSKHLICLSGLA